MSTENPYAPRQIDAVESAIGRALTEVCPGQVIAESAQILVDALRREVVAVPTLDGRVTVQGPDGRSVAEAIRTALTKAEYAPLIRPAPLSPQQQAANQFGRPLSHQEKISNGLLLSGLSPGSPRANPAGVASVGQQMVEQAVANRQAAGNPAIDMSRPMGLRRS
jgi:hypothetical protein